MAENATKTAPISPQFDWDAQDQGLVLGAFYYGFIFTMLPGGYLAERFGPKWVMFVAFLGASLCSLLSPVAAVQGGTVGLIALKVIQGLFQVSLPLESLQAKNLEHLPFFRVPLFQDPLP